MTEKAELSVVYDRKRDVIIIEGTTFSGDFFRSFTAPDPAKLYFIERAHDGTVTVTEAG
mgnify:CR=1 FL=1